MVFTVHTAMHNGATRQTPKNVSKLKLDTFLLHILRNLPSR